MSTQRKFLLATAGIMLGMLAGALYYGPTSAEESAQPASKKEENTVPATIAKPRAIPPIDAAAPAKTETATFALG